MKEKRKVGRPRNVPTPEKMWEHFCAYKADLAEKEKEWQKVQYVGKDGLRVIDNAKLPLTMEGFKRFCWDNGIGGIQDYFTNGEDKYAEFSEVCSRVWNEIRENQINGGMLNFFNPSITQRLNGLADKREIETKSEPRVFNIDWD